jgi:hypothetical protein
MKIIVAIEAGGLLTNIAIGQSMIMIRGNANLQENSEKAILHVDVGTNANSICSLTNKYINLKFYYYD